MQDNKVDENEYFAFVNTRNLIWNYQKKSWKLVIRESLHPLNFLWSTIHES